MKNLKQQGGYTFWKKGNEFQFKFNTAVEDTLQKARRDIPALTDSIDDGQCPVLRKAQDSIDEGITAARRELN